MDFNIAEYLGRINTEKVLGISKMPDYMIWCARHRNRPIESAMNDWLEWNMDLFDSKYIKNECLFEHYEECQKKDPDYFTLTVSWLNEVNNSWHINHKAIDVFGVMYENAFLSGKKASSTGQFFTPLCLAIVMSEMLVYSGRYDTDDKYITLNDPTCGSGRLLLGNIEKINPNAKPFYVGQDLDYTSVMMTSLNLMAHNCHALVVCQDTLLLSEPTKTIVVNEVDFPVHSGFVSVSHLTTEEAIHRGWIESNGPDGYGFSPVPGNYQRICEYFNTQDLSALNHQTSSQ